MFVESRGRLRWSRKGGQGLELIFLRRRLTRAFDPLPRGNHCPRAVGRVVAPDARDLKEVIQEFKCVGPASPRPTTRSGVRVTVGARFFIVFETVIPNVTVI